MLGLEKIFGKKKVDSKRSYTSNIIRNNERINSLYSDEDYALKTIDELRSVSRERARTNPIIGAYARLGENNVVGKGFKLKLSKNQKNVLSKRLEADILLEWDNFIKKENFDASGRLNLQEMCRVLTRGLLIDGENLIKVIREVPNDSNKFGIQFQLLDVNRINSNKNTQNISKGIEFDDKGRATRVYLRKSVQSTSGLKNIQNIQDDGYIDFKDLIYFGNIVSAEQSRGTPYTATALSPVKSLETFDHLTLKAANVGTMCSIYITTDSSYSNNLSDLEEEENHISLSSGGIYKLKPGQNINSLKTEYPVELYNNFVDKKINQIARALGLSSTFLANEIGSANYAIARFMSNEDREFYQTIQQKIIDGFLNKVFREFLSALVLYKNYNTKILSLSFDFVASNFEEIDAVKTQNAKNAELKSLRKSFSRLASENNDSFEDVISEFSADFDLISEKLGVNKEEITKTFLNNCFK
jgi:phage portal protein, lambda family|nr:MAG TPA: portal protein [Caudoviricetes sp.]